MNKMLLMVSLSFLIACSSAIDDVAQGLANGLIVPAGKAIGNTLLNTNPAVEGNQKTISSSGAVAVTTSNSSDDINSIDFGAETIQLIPSGIASGGFFTLTSPNGLNGDGISRIVSGDNYSYSRFGLLYQAGQDTKDLFSQGMPTTDMPTTGQVKYAGDYVLTNETTGRVNLMADFASKTLTAQFDDNFSTTKDKYQAVIAGNEFDSNDDDNSMQGQFYGSQAAELAGTITDRTNNAAFGAKKSP
ncbi:MAG: transferrin-binding protein-like solute binding protein [Ostreibacterium sp.]